MGQRSGSGSVGSGKSIGQQWEEGSAKLHAPGGGMYTDAPSIEHLLSGSPTDSGPSLSEIMRGFSQPQSAPPSAAQGQGNGMPDQGLNEYGMPNARCPTCGK